MSLVTYAVRLSRSPRSLQVIRDGGAPAAPRALDVTREGRGCASGDGGARPDGRVLLKTKGASVRQAHFESECGACPLTIMARDARRNAVASSIKALEAGACNGLRLLAKGLRAPAADGCGILFADARDVHLRNRRARRSAEIDGARPPWARRCSWSAGTPVDLRTWWIELHH